MGKPRTPRGRARETAARLTAAYPEAVCALIHRDPFQLLVATILSAQCTDEMVNKATPALFARYPDPWALAAATTDQVEPLIQTLGLFRSKARHLVAMAATLVEHHESVVPQTMEDLTALPGVGRKTANVVRSVALGLPGLPVDTHVGRISRRLALTAETDAVKAEHALGALLPPSTWGEFSLRVILHGRAVCVSRKPRCAECVLNDFCPSAFRAEVPSP
ncbi:MAG TPA: endonuclease III [Acidimicrobiales bacterium]|nr:endonuclease III [Acidimicrobiales bacterium]